MYSFYRLFAKIISNVFWLKIDYWVGNDNHISVKPLPLD